MKHILIFIFSIITLNVFAQDTKLDYSAAQMDSILNGTKKVDVPTHYNENGDKQILDIDVKLLADKIKASNLNTDIKHIFSVVGDSIRIDSFDNKLGVIVGSPQFIDDAINKPQNVYKKCDGADLLNGDKVHQVQNLTIGTGYGVIKLDGTDCFTHNDQLYETRNYTGSKSFNNNITGISSNIGNGVNNSISATTGFIGNGVNNTISTLNPNNATYNTILNGNTGRIINSAGSIILYGYNNLINNAAGGIIGIGNDNTITGGNWSTITGINNTITDGFYTSILHGSNNTIKALGGVSLYSTIINGSNNTLEGAENSCVFHGFGNKLSDAWETTVLGGYNLEVSGLVGKGFGIWGYNNVKLDQNKFDYNTLKAPFFVLANGSNVRASSYNSNNKSLSLIQTRDGYTQINSTFNNTRALVDAEVLPKSTFEVVSTTSGTIPSSVVTWTELQSIFDETTQTLSVDRVQGVYKTNGNFTYTKKRLSVNSANRPTITGDLWGDGTTQTGKYIPDQEGMIVTAEDTNGNTRTYGLFWVESLSQWRWQPSW